MTEATLAREIRAQQSASGLTAKESAISSDWEVIAGFVDRLGKDPALARPLIPSCKDVAEFAQRVRDLRSH
jgi:hypothetical protein